MSLQNSGVPVIRQGWIRALLLLILYIGTSLIAGLFVSSMQEWIAISFIVAIGLVIIFQQFIDKRKFESVGVEVSKIFPNAFTGMALGVFLVTTGTLVIYFLGGIQWIDIVVNANSLLAGLGLMLMVAFAEEIVFRGYVLQNLYKSMNKWLALVLSAVFFTVVHISNPGIPVIAIINTFLGGLLLGLTAIQTGNLWLPVFFHFTWNYLQGSVIGYNVSGIEFKPLLIAQSRGSEYVSGGEYGFEGSFVATGLLLTACAVWTFLEHRNSVRVTTTNH